MPPATTLLNPVFTFLFPKSENIHVQLPMSKSCLSACCISLLTVHVGQNATNSRVAWVFINVSSTIRADLSSPPRPFGGGVIREAVTTFHSFLLAMKRKVDCPLDAVVYNNHVSVQYLLLTVT